MSALHKFPTDHRSDRHHENSLQTTLLWWNLSVQLQHNLQMRQVHSPAGFTELSERNHQSIQLVPQSESPTAPYRRICNSLLPGKCFITGTSKYSLFRFHYKTSMSYEMKCSKQQLTWWTEGRICSATQRCHRGFGARRKQRLNVSCWAELLNWNE